MSSTDISEIDASFKLYLPTFSPKSESKAKAEKIIKKYGMEMQSIRSTQNLMSNQSHLCTNAPPL